MGGGGESFSQVTSGPFTRRFRERCLYIQHSWTFIKGHRGTDRCTELHSVSSIGPEIQEEQNSNRNHSLESAFGSRSVTESRATGKSMHSGDVQ